MMNLQLMQNVAKVTKISTQDLIYDKQDDRYMSVMLPADWSLIANHSLISGSPQKIGQIKINFNFVVAVRPHSSFIAAVCRFEFGDVLSAHSNRFSPGDPTLARRSPTASPTLSMLCPPFFVGISFSFLGTYVFLPHNVTRWAAFCY